MASPDSVDSSDKRAPWFMTAAAFEGMLDTQPIDTNWWPHVPATVEPAAQQ